MERVHQPNGRPQRIRETRILSHAAQGDDSTSFVEWSAKLGNTELKAGKPEDVDYVNRKGTAVATVGDNNRVYAYDLIHCQLGEYQRIIRRFRLNDPHGYRLIIDNEAVLQIYSRQYRDGSSGSERWRRPQPRR